MDSFPTGEPLIDTNILLQLPDHDLAQVCNSNTYLNQLCQTEHFWKLKVERVYPAFTGSRGGFPNYYSLYRWLSGIQAYVVQGAGPGIFNDIHDAYKSIANQLKSDFPDLEIPPIERAQELIDFSRRVGNVKSARIYTIPLYSDVDLLFSLPTSDNPSGVVSPLLAKMPKLPLGIFLEYVVALGNNRFSLRVVKFTQENLNKIFEAAATPRNFYLDQGVPPAGSLLLGSFSIKGSENQIFEAIGGSFVSRGYPRLIITKDADGKLFLAELPSSIRYISRMNDKLMDELQWRHVEDIVHYL